MAWIVILKDVSSVDIRTLDTCASRLVNMMASPVLDDDAAVAFFGAHVVHQAMVRRVEARIAQSDWDPYPDVRGGWCVGGQGYVHHGVGDVSFIELHVPFAAQKLDCDVGFGGHCRYLS